MSLTDNLPRGRTYNRANLSVLKCASKDNTRYNLNTVAFESNGQTIATDGHTMAVYTPAGVDGRSSSSSYPDDDKPVAVEIDCIKAIHKTIGAKSDFQFISDESGRAIANTSMGMTLPTVTPERGSMELEFPSWVQVLPQPKEPVMARLDAHYLKRIAEAAIEAAECGRGNQVPLDITIDNHSDSMKDGSTLSPVSFEHKTKEGARFLGVVMPMRK